MYTHIDQENVVKKLLTKKDNALIVGLGKVMTTSHYILYVWHINKGVIACITKFFEEEDWVKAWMNK